MKASAGNKTLRAAAAAVLAAAALFAGINACVCFSSNGRIRTLEESMAESGYDCILVLGCGVRDGTPTPALSDRLDTAAALYRAGTAPKILMSGDHGRKDYDEVNVMREYAMARGVPSEDIFLDHAGFSTYETMVRARDVFGVERMIVVTQKFHLYRALYDAAAFGIEAVGTIAEGHDFGLEVMWNVRESAARVKDFFWCLIRPDPTYRGDRIDITGSGEVTLG